MMINSYDVILLLAGESERYNENKKGENKIFALISNIPVYKYSLDIFLKDERVNKIIVVVNNQDRNKFIFNNAKIIITIGGENRSESVKKGLEYVKSEYVLIHDGARPNINLTLINKVLDSLAFNPCVSLGLKVTNTLKKVTEIVETIPRDNIYEMQTPQGFKTSLLVNAYKMCNNTIGMTDDLMLIEKYTNALPVIVQGSNKNIKLTTKDDLELLKFYLETKETKMFKIGQSKDIHKLSYDRKMIIGGVLIPYEKGIEAHSDGDVLIHAISEAIIGSLGYGDLGSIFKDTDSKYENISSLYFLKQVKEMLVKANARICNIDSLVILEKPLLGKYIPEMKLNIAKALEIDELLINIKATRGEGLGYVGMQEGIEAYATVLIEINA